MKQAILSLRDGTLELLEIPCAPAGRGALKIQTQASLISAGTERMLSKFGRAGYLAKARQQPEQVRLVLDRIRTDGLAATASAVLNKLDDPVTPGYCNCGVVLEVGAGVTDFAVGDLVASNGSHAEIVNVPRNLCVKVPPGVPAEHASFASLGAIALQGVRLIDPKLDERIVVYGLGLVGLIAVQLLKAAGARVLGVDLDPARLELAKGFGAEVLDGSSGDPIKAGMAFSDSEGVDGVLITASAKDDKIITQSAQMSRKRGRLVLVGAVDLQLNRSDFYEKELTFQVSCSYGPGRYDPGYEEGGGDYPLPFVRWTAGRNMQAILAMMADGRLNIEPLITSRIPFVEAKRAYDLLTSDSTQLGILLEYPREVSSAEPVIAHAKESSPPKSSAAAPAGKAVVGIIGAGGFTKSVLLPALHRTNAELSLIASRGGLSAAHLARKYGIAASTTDYHQVLDDEAINAVVITTRPDTHTALACEALAAGKHVFVEKPLALNEEQLEQVRQAYENASGKQLLVGFNRRFSPHAVKARGLVADRSGPLCMTAMINAGLVPPEHWGHDPEIGGGRIIGEGCHWIDLMSFFAGAPVVAVQAATVGANAAVATRNDHDSITLEFADGSIGTLHYFANGHRSFPKETITLFCDGKTLVLDNFKRLRTYGAKTRGARLLAQDKGHREEMRLFVDRVATGGEPLIPPETLWNVTLASFAAVRAAAEGTRISLD